MSNLISHGVFHLATGELVQGGLTSDNAIVLATSLTVCNGVDPFVVRYEKTTDGKVRYLAKVTPEDKVKALEFNDQFFSELPTVSEYAKLGQVRHAQQF